MSFNFFNKIITEQRLQKNMVRQSVSQFFAEPFRESFGHLPVSNSSFTWRELAQYAAQETEPLNYNNSTTNSEVVNHALTKKAKLCAVWGDESVNATKNILIDNMRGQGIYRSPQAISFLRDLENDWLLICDECGTTNYPDWEQCKKCESTNTKK